MKILKKITIIPLLMSLIFMNFPQKAEASVSVSARNAILMEQSSGRVLFEKDAHDRRRIASITKIMTAILAIESGKLNETVKVSENAVKTEGSSIYLKPNEKIKLEDLVYGLMLRSGNDSAVAIAEHVGGSLEGFVYMMNQKASEIGMSNTHFNNPHGLDDSDDHYSTAYDMALLTRYSMMNDTYRTIAGTKLYRSPNPEEKWDRVWRNKNRLLTELYEYCTGGKTGYTKLAKRTLVTTATKDEMNLIAVTLNGPDDWDDHINMYETGFKHYSMVEVLSEGNVDAVDNDFYEDKIYFDHDYTYPVKENEKDLFRIEYKMQKPMKEWKEEQDIPDIVGRAMVYFDEKPIKTLPIYYYKDEKADKETSVLDYFKSIFLLFLGVKENG